MPPRLTEDELCWLQKIWIFLNKPSCPRKPPGARFWWGWHGVGHGRGSRRVLFPLDQGKEQLVCYWDGEEQWDRAGPAGLSPCSPGQHRAGLTQPSRVAPKQFQDQSLSSWIPAGPSVLMKCCFSSLKTGHPINKLFHVLNIPCLGSLNLEKFWRLLQACCQKPPNPSG